MADMREKLAELIRKANTAMWGKTIPDRQAESRFIADYLIENGVILPPCKIGDILWIPSANTNKVYSKVIKEILIHEKDGDIGKYVYAASCYFPFENIGKTVFLSKKEAQKVLDERRKQDGRN